MNAVRDPLVLVSGFGSFETFASNPSAEVVRALAAAPPPGMRVRSAVLPVSFARAPAVWDALLDDGEAPTIVLGLGVASMGTTFRLERCAGPRLKLVPRPDVDGRSAHEFSREGPVRATEIELAPVLAALERRGVREIGISESAGGYVCEHLYHHVLERARERGIPALFVHVPPEQHASLPRQIEVVRWVLAELVGADRQSRTSRG
jgi:pyroglutamyl-peptidase